MQVYDRKKKKKTRETQVYTLNQTFTFYAIDDPLPRPSQLVDFFQII